MTRETLELKRNLLWGRRHSLDQQMAEVDKEIREQIIAAGANYVGRTLKRDGGDITEYAMLIAAPFENWHNCMTSPNFNEYQIPAFIFFERGRAFPRYDTIFTGHLPDIEGVRKGNNVLGEPAWEWCEKEEFDSALSALYERVGEMLSAPAQYRKVFEQLLEG